MRTLKILVILAIVATLFFTSANGTISGYYEQPTEYSHCGPVKGTTLYAGQNIDAGDVLISSNADTLWIEIETKDGWYLTESHVHVGDELAAIPQTKKFNPIPGQFDMKATHSGKPTYYILEIPFDDYGFDCEMEIYIAVHVVVKKDTCSGTLEETGWGTEFAFAGKNWATYMKYEIPCCAKSPVLPTGTLTFKWNRGSDSYWEPIIYVNGVEYPVPEAWPRDVWWSWCIDTVGTITPGAVLAGTLVVPDENHPQYEEWCKINWILNHRDDYDANWESVQAAIWKIWIPTKVWALGDGMGSGINLNQDELDDAMELYDDACCCFIPESGNWVAVIFYPTDGNRQDCIIEWDP